MREDNNKSKIECRGRNGWFIYNRKYVGVFDSANDGNVASINLYSSRQGDNPPIMIYGPADEVLKMVEDIASEIKQNDRPKDRSKDNTSITHKSYLLQLLDAADDVVNNWESWNLAPMVNALRVLAAEIREEVGDGLAKE